MKKEKRKISIFGNILLTLFLLISLGAGLTVGFIGGLVKDQPILSQKEMAEQINNISQNSTVYFGSGEKLGTINSELIRKTISYDEMGDNVKNAIIASEDASFYSNDGIEPMGLLRATFSELTGSKNTGGSTITQQLVKNQLLDNSRSYERKAKEILLALRVNNHFSKKEILETYLNVAPFGKNSLGQNISGIETAALGVFGLHAKDLNIAQAAYLVGFVQSPYKYTPFDAAGNIRPEEELKPGLERQKYVLLQMKNNNFITDTQYQEALAFDIPASFTKEKISEYTDYPYIRDEVTTSVAEILAEQTAVKNHKEDDFKNNNTYRNELIEKSKTKFITGGYTVTTTLDKGLYDALQKTAATFASYPSSTQGGIVYPLQVGSSVIDNNTGKVLAFIGGINYDSQQLNHATRTYRSPGSTIKPLLVYGPAIDKGYITPNSLVLDKSFNYNGWTPQNFDQNQRGYLSARRALAGSLNLPTIRLYSAFVNENPVEEYLEKMNFKSITDSDAHTLATAIGGMTYGVSVTENTSAFSTFANMGVHKPAYIIDEIRNKDGEVVYKANFTPTKVYNDSTSYLILSILNDVINQSYGTSPDIAKNLNFSSKNLFVKTGTSEYYKDLWVVGGTKNITVGTWTGYDSPAQIPSYDYAHKAWTAIMNTIYSYSNNLVSPDTAFSRPNSVSEMEINPYNNAKGSTKDLVLTGFKELSKEKTLLKFGYNIDKSLTYSDNTKTQTTTKKSSDNKEEQNLSEHKNNRSDDATRQNREEEERPSDEDED